ncbi:MAG: GNAT family N-acetyltransferase [Flavobacteriales bacterium]|nr:GNAT family N-acetyltransferase [Flavobacteriales bacterium]
MKELFEYKIINRDSDEQHFSNLLENAAFIHNRKQDSLDWLKWKYFNSPYGDCIVVMAYSEKGELAGEISFGKYEFRHNDKVINAIYSYQTMVHPNFQRKGLFGSLTKKVIEIAKEQNIDIIFNFPNHNSYQPFLKLGFKPLNSLKYWVSRGSIKSFVKQFNPISLKKPFIVNKITSYNPNTIDTFNALAKGVHPYPSKDVLYPNRTYDFLKWRYFTYPMHEYKVVESNLGWSIVRVGKRGSFTEAQIMDVFPNKGFNKKFIKSIVKQVRSQLKIGLIVCNMSEAHPLNKKMLSSGFLSIPNKLKFCVYPLNKTGENYLQKENWVITATEFHRY